MIRRPKFNTYSVPQEQAVLLPNKIQRKYRRFLKEPYEVSHKISEFRPLFLGNKGKTKLAQSQSMCITLTYTFLRKIEQISDIY